MIHKCDLAGEYSLAGFHASFSSPPRVACISGRSSAWHRPRATNPNSDSTPSQVHRVWRASLEGQAPGLGLLLPAAACCCLHHPSGRTISVPQINVAELLDLIDHSSLGHPSLGSAWPAPPWKNLAADHRLFPIIIRGPSALVPLSPPANAGLLATPICLDS